MTRRTAAAAVALCFAATGAGAAECAGVTLPDTASVSGHELVLNGLGIRKATLLKVRVYVAGLYLPQKTGSPDASGPWRLVLHFVRGVDAGDIREAFEEGFAKAGGAGLASKIDALNRAVTDFAEGDTLVLDHDPAAGVRVDAKGGGGPTIEGADFARALLGIWTGAEPPNQDLRTGLLGGACE